MSEWLDWWRVRYAGLGGTPWGRLARGQGFVLTTAQADALGADRAFRRRELRAGRWTVPARGALSPVQPGERGVSDHVVARRRHVLSAAATALLRPGQVVSVRSAALLLGLPTYRIPEWPELTAARPRTLGRHGAALVRSACLRPESVGSWFGVPVTRGAQTVVDVARLHRIDGLMAADAALREGLATRAALADAAMRASGWPGVRQAREVVGLASPLAETPIESLLRLRLHDDGFPDPELQVWIGGYRVDAYIRSARLVIEADGRVKYKDGEYWREKEREMQLLRLGERVTRVIWMDLTARGWPATRERLRVLLASSPV